MEELSCSLPTELWHPYGEPELTHVEQAYEGIKSYSANDENHLTDSAYPPRLVRVVSGS
jgi:hypothetical protein